MFPILNNKKTQFHWDWVQPVYIQNPKAVSTQGGSPKDLQYLQEAHTIRTTHKYVSALNMGADPVVSAHKVSSRTLSCVPVALEICVARAARSP
jgi:hypothetical protein